MQDQSPRLGYRERQYSRIQTRKKNASRRDARRAGFNLRTTAKQNFPGGPSEAFVFEWFPRSRRRPPLLSSLGDEEEIFIRFEIRGCRCAQPPANFCYPCRDKANSCVSIRQAVVVTPTNFGPHSRRKPGAGAKTRLRGRLISVIPAGIKQIHAYR